MPELLTGTVTFVFSDIEGSTRLLRARGEGWPAMLERHQQLLRAAFTAHGGREMGTEGDSFFVAFPSAPGAVSAAVDAQRALHAEPWPEGSELRVRIGMHTGEAGFSAKTYAGLHVHRASRIASVAHGEQVLLSDATRILVEHELPEGVALRDLGEHRLRDLEEPERLWQLVIPDLPSSFPPLASLDGTPNNLPPRLTTFLGRERELTEVGELLATHRLVTLTGPGGTGKTRLSLEVAERGLEQYPDGVFFVELSPIREIELVAAAIAQALALPERGRRDHEERLVDHIGDRRMLLVLDNFEQVAEAAPVLGRLLTSAANLSILVSSRSVLRLAGEQEYPVPPLRIPDPHHLPPLAQLSQYEAVALFIERARAVKPDFTVTNENAPAVAEICVRLDGLPLAIELAAARIRILTPQAMLGRLGHRLDLLSAAGARDRPERQQTLRGAIAWSHDMLDETDRALFAGLSVFVGGASLEAIEQVCGPAMSGECLDALASLVEKSLLRQFEGVDGEPRFAMLETIREFAWEQAVERGDVEELRSRHAAYFRALAEEVGPGAMTADSRRALDRLEQDHDNLRAAIAWALEANAAETALRLGAALWRFWEIRGHLAEGLERVEAALALPHGQEHPEARADALSAAAGLAYWIGDADHARDLYAEEIEARTALGDRRGLAEAEYSISFTWAVREMLDAEKLRVAREHATRGLEIFTELGDRFGIGRSEWAVANIAWGARDMGEARLHAAHALEVFEAVDDRFHTAWASYTLGLASLAEEHAGANGGLLDEAVTRLRRALQLFTETQDVTAYTLVIDALAVAALARGNRQRAARMAGAVATLERTTGTGLNAWNRAVLGFDPTQLRDDPSLADAWAEGAALTPDEAVALALAE